MPPFRRSSRARPGRSARIARGRSPSSSARRDIWQPYVTSRRPMLEALESRSLLSVNLGFAVAGANGGQGLAVATDTSGNVYELSTDAVYKFDASGNELWAASYSASSTSGQKEGLAVDAGGNAFITGNFSGGATFGATTLTSAGGSDGYLTKLDGNGGFLWAESFGGTQADAAYAVATDASGNAFVTGDMSSSATFGSGAGAVVVASAGSTDAFVAKFGGGGQLNWAQAIGGAGADIGRGVAVDAQGDVYTTGQFSGTVDFDPASPGTHRFTTSLGTDYILKLDGGGSFLWAEQLNSQTSQGNGTSVGDALTVDAAGNVYSTGVFGGPIDLNASAGGDVATANLTAPDAFVLKLTAMGGFGWAAVLHNVSGTNPLGGFEVNGISLDDQGDVLTTGDFSGIADFDPGIGTNNQQSAGGKDIYVSALDRQGNFAWAVTAGEAGDEAGYGIATNGTNRPPTPPTTS
jgi:hypothetical protein